MSNLRFLIHKLNVYSLIISIALLILTYRQPFEVENSLWFFAFEEDIFGELTTWFTVFQQTLEQQKLILNISFGLIAWDN